MNIVRHFTIQNLVISLLLLAVIAHNLYFAFNILSSYQIKKKKRKKMSSC